MSLRMRKKLDKYFSCTEKCHMMVLNVVVLDLRENLNFFRFCHRNEYDGELEMINLIVARLKLAFQHLFEYYELGCVNGFSCDKIVEDTGLSSGAGLYVDYEIYEKFWYDYVRYIEEESNLGNKS